MTLELRLTATSADAWRAVRRYDRLIGPFSRLLRRHLLEPLGPMRSRLVSRYRISYPIQHAARFGPARVEPVGFAMDRKMLEGIKTRVERAESRRVSSAAPAARTV